jgi:hypothetical protein
MSECTRQFGRLSVWTCRGIEPRKFGVEFYPDRHWALDITFNRFVLALWWSEKEKP